MEKSQEEVFNKLKAYFDFTKGGNDSYRAKKIMQLSLFIQMGTYKFKG